MEKCVVLLSSGLDSTVNLFAAHEKMSVALVITFNYGQRAALKEINAAQKLTNMLKLNHQVVDLPWFPMLGLSSLTHQATGIPVGSQVQIDDPLQSIKTAKAVWVPNRNGIFLNIAAGFAESLGADWIIPGFNAEEASTFPDNSEDFLNHVTQSLHYSTSNHVKVQCFTTHLQKVDIVKMGQELGVPWKWIWPCYFGEEKWCGICESCQRSLRAFEKAGVDPSKFLLFTI